ncbi:MAG: hypothetical protein ACYDHM_09925 [Acidiferrobacterales bacterium]
MVDKILFIYNDKDAISNVPLKIIAATGNARDLQRATIRTAVPVLPQNLKYCGDSDGV